MAQQPSPGDTAGETEENTAGNIGPRDLPRIGHMAAAKDLTCLYTYLARPQLLSVRNHPAILCCCHTSLLSGRPAQIDLTQIAPHRLTKLRLALLRSAFPRSRALRPIGDDFQNQLPLRINLSFAISLGTKQVGKAQIGSSQIGPAQIGEAQVGSAQIRLAQVGPTQISFRQDASVQIGFSQVSIAKQVIQKK